ncbi:MAG: SRPBCC family protein [Myxococcota bacterium]
MTRLPGLALLCTLVLQTTPVANGVPTLSVAQQQRLEHGEVLVTSEVGNGKGGRRGWTQALGIINAPPATAWAVVQDYDTFVRLTPRLADYRVMERTAERIRVTQEIKVLFHTYRYTLWLDLDASGRHLRWKLDPTQPHDVRDIDGSWQFLPWDGNRTLMVYRMELDSGVWVPRVVEEYLTGRDLPTLLGNMRRQTEKVHRGSGPR